MDSPLLIGAALVLFVLAFARTEFALYVMVFSMLLSPEITANHPGGALEELFTVYTIVNALTVNLPAITHVQILVNGKEADTLAGHVDLRQPLIKNLTWVKTDNPS